MRIIKPDRRDCLVNERVVGAAVHSIADQWTSGRARSEREALQVLGAELPQAHQ